MPVVSLQKITKYFGKTPVLKNISLNFEEGKFACLLGSSGSGKTTILRLIAGLEEPDGGKIFLNGELANENKLILIPASQREIGFIFQDLALWPHLTVYENIDFGLKIKNVEKANSKISDVLGFFGIDGHKNKYPNQLSGGQQQLVAIARSLVLNPKILLMDEPLANLDVKLKSKIRNQVKNLIRNFSITIIYVTHDHHEAFNLADEIVVLNEGKIEAIGTSEEIQKSENAYVKGFIEI
jgi:ABC-type Fe3+/spermidine/putrescine transport system ATPase subunit